MRVVRRRRLGAAEVAASTGPARVDTRTKRLTARLREGEVAVIDHADLDRVSAEALRAARPAAVVNAARSTSGRYPNLGPAILVEAGIPLVDDAGPRVMRISEGSLVLVDDDGSVSVGGVQVAAGTVQDAASVESALAEARTGMAEQLKAFAANTMHYVEREQDLIIDGVTVPETRTRFEDRHVLIVVRGYHYREDLAMLRPYVREFRPLMLGVDGGADAILEAGYRPDVIVGDMDSVSDRALRSGAEIFVHGYRDGRAPGRRRVEELGVEHTVLPATGTSEDVAMLLADEKGASVIVAVGTHNTLVEFLDKGREGMASTFLTRLRVGSKLIDAKGVSRLYRTSISGWMLTALVAAGLLAFVAAIATTSAGQTMFELIQTRLGDLVAWLGSLFGGG